MTTLTNPNQYFTTNSDTTPPPQSHHISTPERGSGDDNPEDVLFDSLQTLYGYQPITFTSAGATYTYTHWSSTQSPPITITLQTPDTEAANWSLHASSVWVASTQLAHGLNFLRLDDHLQKRRDRSDGEKFLRVLELGAAAGLPSILIAKLYPNLRVLATDYPDKQLIRTLSENIKHNGVETNCCVVPYSWGSDPTPLFSTMHGPDHRFDVIIAADTLWNSESHAIFIDTLQKTLRKDAEARVYLVAGLHTGRYTINSFLGAVARAGFRVIELVERGVMGSTVDGVSGEERQWDVSRADYEEERDRRRWVIWIELCWEDQADNL